jgi:hypothetical protein
VSQVRFQADWNLNHIIVQAAQRREPTLDFQTAHAAGLLGVSDLNVLARAVQEGQLLVTPRRGSSQLSAALDGFL